MNNESEVKRWKLERGVFYECDANGDFIYTEVDGKPARRIKFFDGYRSTLVAGEDYDALKARCEAAEELAKPVVSLKEGLVATLTERCMRTEADSDKLLARAEGAERDARRYAVLRNSVLSAPMSAGMTLLSTAADIDAQCDQLRNAKEQM